MRNAVLIGMLLVPLSLSTARGAAWSWFNRELPAIERECDSIARRAATLPPIPPPQMHERAGFHSGFAPDADTVRWVQVDLGREQELDAVVVVPAFFGTQLRAPGPYGFPPRFRVDVSTDPGLAESVTLLDHTDRDCVPLMAPLHIPAHRVKARYVRFTATKLHEDAGENPRSFFCLGELLAFSGGTNVSALCEVRAAKAVESVPTWSPRNLVDGFCALGLPVVPEPERTHGWRSDVAKAAESVKWVQVDLGAPRLLQEVRLIPAHPPDFPERPAFGFPLRFKVEVDDDPLLSSPRLVFDHTREDFPNPGDNPLSLPAEGIHARYVRVTATRLWERDGGFVFALGELEVYSGGANIARSATVQALDDSKQATWQRQALIDGLAGEGALMEWSEWLRLLSERRELRERFKILEKQRDLALIVAQRSALWCGVAAISLLLLLAVVVAWRTRDRQRRELQSLRERIARDLHDDLGSHLGSIRMMSELALRHTPASNDLAPLQEIQRLSAEAAESMHAIVWLMRESGNPPMSRLIEAIQQSAETLLPEIQREMQFPTTDLNRPASLDFHRHILLFVRESLHNIARHASALSLYIETTWDTRTFRLNIRDDGCGFDTGIARDGSGLANLRHRATTLGGHVTIVSAPGQGTRIHLEVPLS